MKRIIILEPCDCGEGDTTENNIYNIIEDEWLVWNKENFDNDLYEYNEENIIKYPKGIRCITINDDSNDEDTFEVAENENRFMIFENDKELAHKLIEMIDGLGETIINMSLLLKNK